MTTQRPARPAIPTAPNLRDLGGWPTRDGGVTRSGRVFRSAELSRLTGDDVEAFAAFGIGSVFDLRTTHEIKEQPDLLPEGLEAQQLDVLADQERAAPAEMRQLFADPAVAGDLLGNGQAERYFEQAYGDFVTLGSARLAYRELFTAIADAESPVLFHCATGKDRTGWAAAALLLLLGVSEEAVMEEYLLTNTDLLPMVQPWIDSFTEVGGDPDLLTPILGVQESYLEAALARVRSSYGDIEGYVTTGLGLSTETVDRLRDTLVQSAG